MLHALKITNRVHARILSGVACFVVAALCGAGVTHEAVHARTNTLYAARQAGDVRAAIETAFGRLRAGDYGAIYDALPRATRRRITRAKFVGALRDSRGRYELDRLEITSVERDGEAAAADTVVYGRVRDAGAGKIEIRQYLAREDGVWRVVTDDRATVRRLLAAHPKLARRFPAAQPRVFVRRDERWVDLTPGKKSEE